MDKISENVYVETGFIGCNVGFVVTASGIVMIDTPMVPTEAIKWRNIIAEYGQVQYIVNTEPHLDHYAGNHFFEGTIIGHEGIRRPVLSATVEELKKRINKIAPESLPLLSEFSFHPPDITCSRNCTLFLGNHTFQLIHMPGHTAYQLAVYIPEERVAFTSDNVFYRVQAFLDSSLPFEWLESLKRLQKLEVDTLVPGHGEICDLAYLPEMSAFINDWINAVSDAIDRGISLEEAKDTIAFYERYPMLPGSESMKKWLQHRNVERLYKIISRNKTSKSG